MDEWTLARAAAGGLLIGGAASGLLWLNGRIAGVSGIAAGLLATGSGERGWRAAFVLGLLGGGLLLLGFDGDAFGASPASLGRLALAGLLVGVGTRLANGCTSGHGVCGMARRSRRSLAATATFMATGALTVFVIDHLFGGAAP